MTDFYPKTINRSLIVLLPKQPVLDWLLRVDPELSATTLAELRQECDGILVPDRIEDFEDAQAWVHEHWKMFFEDYLADWYQDEEPWPKKRTLKMFKEWFEIQFTSMVWDFAEQPVVHHYDD